MEFSIRLNEKDWKQFYSYVQKELAKSKPPMAGQLLFNILLWFFIAFEFMLVFFIYKKDIFNLSTAFAVTTFFLIIIMVYFSSLVRIQKASRPSSRGIFIGEHNFSFDEEGISSKGENYESKNGWGSVLKIERAMGMIIIYFDTTYAFIFPESKLEEPNDLYNYIHDKYEKYNKT